MQMIRQRRLVLILIAMMVLLPGLAGAADAVRVLVVPFEINSLADLSYLQTEIPEVIGSQLRQEGALTVPPPVDMDMSLEEVVGRVDNIRQMGVRGKKEVIEKFSLDAMVEAYIGVYRRMLSGA